MPTIFTHGFVGLLGGKIFADAESAKFRILSAIVPIIPDADVIAFRFGISYDSALGHRGFTHSVVFALLIALIVMFAAFRKIKFGSKNWYKYALFFFLIGLSHPILDAFTNGGLGVGLLIPFEDSRFFAPFRPIEVSPIGIRRFFGRLGVFCFIERVYLGLESFADNFADKNLHRKDKKQSGRFLKIYRFVFIKSH